MTWSQALPQVVHSGVGGTLKYRQPCSLECVSLIHSAWESSGLPRTCWARLGRERNQASALPLGRRQISAL